MNQVETPHQDGGPMSPLQAKTTGRYVPALGLHWLTPCYDTLLRLGGREQAFKRQLLDQADIRAGEAVLDVGCGTGTLALLAKQRVADADVTGLDGDPEMLRRARSKAQHAGLAVRFDEGVSVSLPYAAASQDVVLSTLFFHHLDAPGRSKTLQEIFRVLKPGGRLHVADWGLQPSLLMRVLSLPDRLLDGINRTADNFAGRLPALVSDAGFVSVAQTGCLTTPFGRLTFFAAGKPR
jgi:SAM-dependent methyltransferase